MATRACGSDSFAETEVGNEDTRVTRVIYPSTVYDLFYAKERESCPAQAESRRGEICLTEVDMTGEARFT